MTSEDLQIVAEAFCERLEAQLPAAGPFQLGALQPVKARGVYAASVLGAVFNGEQEGKLTVGMEWASVQPLAESLTGTPVEGPCDVVNQALQSFFEETLKILSERIAEKGRRWECQSLPLLSETSALLAEEPDMPILRLELSAKGVTVNLFVAFRIP